MSSKARILLTDDNRDIRELLPGLFQRRSHTVLTAASGKQALDIMHDNEIDILVTDINMPGMDGIELIRKTREYYPKIKCIVMTGETGVAAKIRGLGVISLLQKPGDLDPDILDSAIEKGMSDKKTEENQV